MVVLPVTFFCRFPNLSTPKQGVLFFTSLLLICTSGYVNGQNALPVDTTKTYYPNSAVESAVPYYHGKPEGVARYYYDNHNLKEERTYSAGRVDGVVRRYDKNGTLREMFTIENGKREGAFSIYDAKGNYVEDKIYVGGKVQPPDTSFALEEPAIKDTAVAAELPPAVQEEIRPAILPEQPPVETAPVVQSTDTLIIDFSDSIKMHQLTMKTIPEPLHGLQHFYSKLYYPSKAQEKRIQGIVKIKALVDKYGDVLKTQILNGIGLGCEEAAEIAVFYTKFIPAVIKKDPVTCYVIFPVEFTLPKVKK